MAVETFIEDEPASQVINGFEWSVAAANERFHDTRFVAWLKAGKIEEMYDVTSCRVCFTNDVWVTKIKEMFVVQAMIT